MLNCAELEAELLLTLKAQQCFLTLHKSQDYISSVCKALDVSVFDVTSKSRDLKNVDPRFIIYYLLKHHTDLTLKQIGALVGGKDHTTILSGLKAFKNLVDTKDKLFIAKLKKVQAELPGIDFFNQ